MFAVMRRPQSATRSISLASSAGAFELLIRFNTGDRCNNISLPAGSSNSDPSDPVGHRTIGFAI
jgi:hypothetical protein